MSHSVTAPIHLAGTTTHDVIPHSYVLHQRSQQCKNCGTLHEWCELYVKTHLRSRTGAGKYVTNLRPCDTPEWQLPLEIIPTTIKQTPFCQECAWDFERDRMRQLPTPPAPTLIVGTKHSEPTAIPTVSKKPKSPLSLDDILETL